MKEEKYGDSYGEKFRQYEDKIKELEKKNEVLKGQMSLHEGLLWNDLHKLEKENAELRNNGFTVSAMTEQQLKVALEKGEQLEKKIAELKCECRRCVYTDSPCVLSDYGKDRNGICDHFKDVFDENAELKADNDARKFAMAMSEKVEKQLREENARLNRLSDMQDKTVVDLTKTCEQRREQLTNTKEIIKKFSEFANLEVEYDPEHPQEHTDLWNELCKEAEQFLKEE